MIAQILYDQPFQPVRFEYKVYPKESGISAEVMHRQLS